MFDTCTSRVQPVARARRDACGRAPTVLRTTIINISTYISTSVSSVLHKGTRGASMAIYYYLHISDTQASISSARQLALHVAFSASISQGFLGGRCFASLGIDSFLTVRPRLFLSIQLRIILTLTPPEISSLFGMR